MTPSIGSHQLYLGLAEQEAKRSPDPSTKVGCVVRRARGFDILGRGYNSFPDRSFVPHSLYYEREEKYDRIIHAEVRALFDAAAVRRSPLILYTTFPPCKECAKHMVERDVIQVVMYDDVWLLNHQGRSNESWAKWMQSFEQSKKILAEADIEILYVSRAECV